MATPSIFTMIEGRCGKLLIVWETPQQNWEFSHPNFCSIFLPSLLPLYKFLFYFILSFSPLPRVIISPPPNKYSERQQDLLQCISTAEKKIIMKINPLIKQNNGCKNPNFVSRLSLLLKSYNPFLLSSSRLYWVRKIPLISDTMACETHELS